MSIRSRMNRRESSVRWANPVPSWRPVRLGLIAAAGLFAFLSRLPAQEAAPFPEFDGSRVYRGAGIPDRYQAVARQIERLDKVGTPRYYVVVLRSSGPKTDKTATLKYVDRLSDAWRDQAAAKGLRFDPDRSVLVVVAIDNHQVAVSCRQGDQALGLHGETITRDVIDPSRFKEHARSGEYPEAIAALLDTTDRWIGAMTRRPACRSRRSQVPAPAAARATATGSGPAIGLGLSLLAIVAAVLGALLVRPPPRTEAAWISGSRRSDPARPTSWIASTRSRNGSSSSPRRTPISGRRCPARPRHSTPRSRPPWASSGIDGSRSWSRSTGAEAGRRHHLALQEEGAARRRVPAGSEGGVRGDRRGSPSPAPPTWTGSTRRTRRRGTSWRRSAGRSRSSTPRSQAIGEAGPADRPLPGGADRDRRRDGPGPRADRRRTRSAPDRRSKSCTRRAEGSSAGMERVAALFQEAQKVATALEGCSGRSPSTGRRACGSTRRAAIRITRWRRPIEAHAGAVEALARRRSRRGGEGARDGPIDGRAGPGHDRAGPRSPRLLPSRAAGAAPGDRTPPGRAAAGGGRLSPAGARIRRRVLGGVAQNLDQIRGLLASFDAMAAEAADAASDQSQRYLAGAGCSASSPSSSRPRCG